MLVRIRRKNGLGVTFTYEQVVQCGHGRRGAYRWYTGILHCSDKSPDTNSLRWKYIYLRVPGVSVHSIQIKSGFMVRHRYHGGGKIWQRLLTQGSGYSLEMHCPVSHYLQLYFKFQSLHHVPKCRN